MQHACRILFSECTCNLFGIVSNDGCDQYNGTCTCKRFVVGRDCNQCQALFYGLSLDDPYGCKVNDIRELWHFVIGFVYCCCC